MKQIAVLTSGGDSPGMNAAVRAVAKVAAARGVRVVGVVDGYEGLFQSHFRQLTHGESAPVPDPQLDWLGGTGGTLLGTARCARFMTSEGRAQAARSLAGVDGLVVIGGNGSLTGAHLLALEQGVKVVGIPASIDNDIGCTSTAIGVDTALNTIVEACDRISDTARSHHRAFVLEVMGRQCGYLAMASAVAAGADGVLFREQGRTEEQLVEVVARLVRQAFSKSKRRVLILKAEGVEMPCTKLVRQVGEVLAPELPGLEIRATVLGHVVRGGSPTYMDRMVAGRLALGAVESLLAGAADEMVGWMSPVPGGHPTADPAVMRFGLSQVVEETACLIDGTSPVTRRRIQMMEAAEGVLPL